MRVAFFGRDLRCWFPAGRFDVRADHTVDWLTPLDSTREWASTYVDGEIALPEGRAGLLDRYVDGGEAVVDAVAFEDGVVAILRQGRSSALVRVDGAGRTLWYVALVDNPPRVPGYSPQEEWQTLTLFIGSDGTGGLRVREHDGTFAVTANETGHVGIFDAAGRRVQSWRVPGAPENSVYAARLAEATLIGIKFNGRHSELRVVADDGRIVGQWPPAEQVRWGMPEPVVLGDFVVTYSDEGPHRKHLHVMSLPSLEEVSTHGPLSDWPVATAVDPMTGRFAVAAPAELVVGRLDFAGVVEVDLHVSLAELVARSGAERPPRPTAATVDGRGGRIWLASPADFWGVVDGEAIHTDTDGAIWGRRPDDEPRLILAARPSRRVDALFGFAVDDAYAHATVVRPPTPRCLHVAGREVLFVEDARLFRLHVQAGALHVLGEEPDDLRAARIFGDDVFIVDAVRPTEGIDDRLRWRLLRPDGSVVPISESWSEGCISLDGSGSTLVWAEYHCEKEEVSRDVSGSGVVHRQLRVVSSRWELCRIELGAATVTRSPLEDEPRSIAFLDDTVYVVGGEDSSICRVAPDGTFVPIAAVPYFATSLTVRPGAAFVLEPTTLAADGRQPSAIHRIDLGGGRIELLATETFAPLGGLCAASGRLWWYEGEAAAGRAMFGGPSLPVEDQSICWLDES